MRYRHIQFSPLLFDRVVANEGVAEPPNDGSFWALAAVPPAASSKATKIAFTMQPFPARQL
ncbi:hypothetical protein MTX26_34800 [Bradyrhizobium sp. ISRA443]|uniref:hypothetical protein n=1 Tax=unclassified Bradyrhizobium TaxID=2631580 RepID=UPI00247A1D68|nr:MULTISPECIES: hypothetical protein [unclassified Bradyrhizobium]WGR94542.1 hypothetical protein MTX20_09940 [Bradyrhizobium sp. ISRA435]WGR99292.1 hypothetical protein MTX23_34780 [Bradyrhizobium sp. ISRA436]WGS06184.1 hypothetical protein MTX18_34800 [Bradyrhizobium sp. ISRA437]WGS13069.1 hypothetical protein MTX26_34800 [Bradyrhizobium sp. ISRA443]